MQWLGYAALLSRTWRTRPYTPVSLVPAARQSFYYQPAGWGSFNVHTSSETEAKTTPTSGSVDAAPQSTGSSGEVENPFLEVFSESDSSDNERCAPFKSKSIFAYVFHILLKVPFFAKSTLKLRSVGGEDEFSEGRRRFLEACRHRREGQRSSISGPEETVAGCGCFLRLSSRPPSSAVQVLLLAVRHRWRRAGLGSFLLQVCLI